jgi:hypothetical protein
MSKFYVPYMYFFQVHARTISRILSWGLIYFVPVFLYVYFIGNADIINSFIIFVFLTTIIYNLYEIGYINNDTETIKKENNPTIRLSIDELKYYENNKKKIYLIRIFIALILIVFVNYLSIKLNYEVNLYLFFSLMVLMMLFYKAYNSIRSKMNIVISIILSTFRYVSVPISIINENYLILLILVIVIFPLVNLLNWLSKPKYNINFAIRYLKDIELIRVIYYSILSLILLIFYFILSIELIKYFLYVSIYFLFIRVVYFLIMKKSISVRESVSYARKTKYYEKENFNDN